MANRLRLETKGLDELITRLESLGGDVQKAVTDALMQASQTVQKDTIAAIESQNLPAKGKFMTGKTRESVIESKIEWSGMVAEARAGFDYSNDITGIFLIYGTPRMQPDQKLAEIFIKKQYMTKMQNDMKKVVESYILAAMEGKK